MGSGCSSHFLFLPQSGQHFPAVSYPRWRHDERRQEAGTVSREAPGDAAAVGDVGTADADVRH